jgi:hypothetical protein
MRILNAQPRAVLCCVALFLSSAAGLKAGPVAYEISGAGEFGTIDLGTGVITPIGSSGVNVEGLGVYGPSIFAAKIGGDDSNANALYRVNPVDGSITFVGDPGYYWDWGGFGSTTSGLYAVGITDLFSINPSTGVATDIGPTGIGAGQTLSVNSDTLYFAQGYNLYTLNTSTGLATLIGATGDESQMYALLVVDGILYGVDGAHGTIDTIDTTTGHATVLSTIDFHGSPYGLAPGPVPASGVPEPGSAFLLTAGVAGLIVAKRKMRNPRTSPTL